MAQFEVPQFINLESKIVGPLTLRQFGFIAVPALASFFLYFVLSIFIWAIVSIILLSAGSSLAFLRASGRPMYKVVLFAFAYFWKPKLFLWKRPEVKEIINIPDIERKRGALQLASSGVSSVSNLWQEIITRKNPIPMREKSIPNRPVSDIKEQYQVFKRITGDKSIARRVDYR